MQPLGIGEEPARPPARGGYNLSYRPVQDEFNMATNHAWYAKTGWRLHGLFDILVVDYETAARENMKVVILKTSGKKIRLRLERAEVRLTQGQSQVSKKIFRQHASDSR